MAEDSTTPTEADSVAEEERRPRTEADSVAEEERPPRTEAEPTVAEDTDSASAQRSPAVVKRLEEEGDAAADYLEELLDIADLDGDLDLDVEGDRAVVSIVGTDVQILVGGSGEVLEALQALTRLAVLAATGERSRLMLDIGGHRAHRRRALEGQAREAVARVRERGEPERMAPMSAFERKVVHDAVAAAGLGSASEGEGADRRVVISPARDGSTEAAEPSSTNAGP